MNNYQTTLWNDLMNLCDSSEAFYYNDHLLDSTWYRIFNYRLASYEDFLASNALECRGHMFEISEEGKQASPVRLASLPQEKFFNVNENPFTMDLDFSRPMKVMLKEDGSLISTYLHNGTLRVKSKGSLSSDQAIAAQKFLELERNKAFYNGLLKYANDGHTINMEWCAPDNRIVICYGEPKLTVLNFRDMNTGEYADFDEGGVLGEVAEHFVQDFSWNKTIAMSEQYVLDNYVNVKGLEGIEGYVIRLNTGQHVKVKTEWYLVQHRAKDNVLIPRRLYEAVLEEVTDDLRTLFFDNPEVIRLISDMEKKVEKLYNHTVDVVERFYARNKALDRKDYAILGQGELSKFEFGLAINKYIGRPANYKEEMKKRWKQFGISNEKQGEDE